MKINIENIKTLIKEKYRGNVKWFTEEINVDYSYFNRILNGKIDNNSKKVYENIITYCKEKGYDYTKYVFLP